MFISNGLAYLTVRCHTDEEMGSLLKVLLTPSGEWKPSYIYNYGQWEDSEDELSIGSNVSDTSSSQSTDVFKSILSEPHYKDPTVTFADDVAFPKSATGDELFYDIPELDMRKFDYYNGISISLDGGPFDPNYV